MVAAKGALVTSKIIISTGVEDILFVKCLLLLYKYKALASSNNHWAKNAVLNTYSLIII
jgi:hypothetical protein